MATLDTSKDYTGKLITVYNEYGARVGYLLSEDKNYFNCIIKNDVEDLDEDDVVQFSLEEVNGATPSNSSSFVSYVAIVNKKLYGVDISEIKIGSSEGEGDQDGKVRSSPIITVEGEVLKLFSGVSEDEVLKEQNGVVEDENGTPYEYTGYRFKGQNINACKLEIDESITFRHLGNGFVILNRKNGCDDSY